MDIVPDFISNYTNSTLASSVIVNQNVSRERGRVFHIVQFKVDSNGVHIVELICQLKGFHHRQTLFIKEITFKLKNRLITGELHKVCI